MKVPPLLLFGQMTPDAISFKQNLLRKDPWKQQRWCHFLDQETRGQGKSCLISKFIFEKIYTGKIFTGKLLWCIYWLHLQ